MTDNMKKISDIGFVPLIVLEDAADAVPFAKALEAGGIPVAEVTFRTAAAKEIIEKIAKEVPEVLVGAGTVHTVQQAKEAVIAGAKFVVTPGFNPEVVGWCVDNKVDVVPGVISPAEVEQAMGFGLSICKFFPAEAYGGIKTLESLAGPYAGIKFMPTGGVSADNMNDYLSLPNVIAVGGSFMAPYKLVASKKWDEITALCKETVKKQMGFQLLHVGINTKDADDACTVAHRLGDLFLQEVKEFPGAYFAGSTAEVVKGKFLGAMGHIAIQTNDIDRAVAYFERNGVEIDHSTAVRGAAGKLIAIYFKEEVGGFALHLRCK
ncbi:bifunctional 4-hydroxy-2-oxoglutarate aldolase/2-dehydro-3-deoxy-phosphogluconate aldolase [Hydrogenoanaerobacterium sp.]|uniref:bifunctional 4-hydroxy-2-oxoglutarate aldolase/2-dehydro-3-deoxy-phosphogluconate aldolase n=1 Tax=Hydrogenoanaerobacterium sp. TaxID=2953763 RepID=UPI00289BFFD4|nr:bifunctional 4-hydroxy-2-oxoglutarate aldolase/2-dehydro-3-deoxy-phosphogluconate aldolase [Hydrogenoanaerobacterium sp.]